jgi:hypothetical protein
MLTIVVVGHDSHEQSMLDLPSMGEHSNRDVRNPSSGHRLQFGLSRNPVASRI